MSGGSHRRQNHCQFLLLTQSVFRNLNAVVNAEVELDSALSFKRSATLRVCFHSESTLVTRSRWGPCLDLFCREMSPRSAYWSALMDPAVDLIDVAVLFASWLSHREDGPACTIAVLCWLASLRSISLTTRLKNNS